MPLTPQARSVYRALLREHPRRNLLSPTSSSSANTNTSTSTTTPLHNHLRELFRSGAAPTTTEAKTKTAQSKSRKKEEEKEKEDSEIEYQRGLQRMQEAQQVAQYARAQRTYMSLLEMYYPGMSMDEEEKVRLTARKVGFDLPVMAEGQ